MSRKKTLPAPAPVAAGPFDFHADPRDVTGLVIVGHLSETDATSDLLARIADAGWQVVNAPRPIPGAVAWRGVFLHGCYYAAGDASAPSEYGESLAERWAALDAWPVCPIRDDQVRAWLDAQLVREGSDPAADVIRLGGYAKLARFYRLPYEARDVRCRAPGDLPDTCAVMDCGAPAAFTEWTTRPPMAFYPLCEEHALKARKGVAPWAK